MSGGNPYAVNGQPSTNASNSNVSGRGYGGLYQQQNPSSGSVASYASRERRRRDDAHPNRIEENPNPPYAQERYGSGSVDYGQASRPIVGSRDQDYNAPRERRVGPTGANGFMAYSPRRTPKMDEVVQHIQSNWKDMSADDCVPVQVALKLMDPSSLGLADKEPDFQQTHLDLQKTLKAIVNEHHQDFNSSIGTYHKIQANIQASQSRVRYLRQALSGAQDSLLTTKPELKGLATSSQELDDTLQLFGQIEHLQAVPEKLEARISEKRFLTAVDLLQDALRLVRKSELDGIGAITDLRTYFTNQEQSLTDILIEELHDHLYLKSPYCVDRWKAKNANGDEKDAQASMRANGVNPWDKPVYHYLSSLDTKTPMSEDASRNPEADTFYYIHMIVEALNRLGCLEDAVGRIEQRMPVEMYKLVDKTNAEIDARHPSHIRGQLNKRKRNLNMPMQETGGRGAVLSDFLWTLYAKFEAIAEGHRVLHEVIVGIVAREQLPTPERYTGGFKELWKLYQLEMRSLLHDYLATDGDLTLRTHASSASGGDVFARHQRDKNKKMFKLSEMDQKSLGIKAEQEELDEILKTSVPGLVSKTRAKSGLVSVAERNGEDSTAAGHKLLIEPTVFNMTILLAPSLTFLQHLKDIVPVSSNIPMSTLTSFLDDFLINVFHPQLEEAVTELCSQCMIDLEAFSEDSHWAKVSPRPIFKGTSAFMTLIRAFSGMLSSIPQDQIFTQLVISQLVAYYDSCYGYYKGLVSRLAPSPAQPNVNVRTLKAAAAFAESGEIHDIASEILRDQDNPGTTASARVAQIDKEVQLLLAATKSPPLTSYDIISDPRSVQNLSILYNSMQWLSSSLAQLRHVDSTTSKPHGHSRNVSQSRRWTLITSLKSQSKSSSANPIRLPLTSESVIPFDTTLSSFRTLAHTALLTLHVDIRCGIIHQLGRSLRGPESTPPPDSSTGSTTTPIPPTPGSAPRDSAVSNPALSSAGHPLAPSSPPTAASPLILSLNTDLIAFDTNVASLLPTASRRFITTGLSRLVDRALVAGAEWVGVMNEHGAMRMGIDGLVIQQNLRNIVAAAADSAAKEHDEDGADQASAVGLGIVSRGTSAAAADDGRLALSEKYYALFLDGPDQILQYVKTQKGGGGLPFSYDELRTLIELCYSVALRSDDREESVRARKAMGDALLRLGELMWDS